MLVVIVTVQNTHWQNRVVKYAQNMSIHVGIVIVMPWTKKSFILASYKVLQNKQKKTV